MQFIADVLQFFGTLLLVLLVFNLIIIVHELGHFLAAKWRGLKIEKFQIWFGKAIWKKKIDGVQFGLGSIPAGGFVALPQMAPMEMLEGATEGKYDDMPKVSPLDKIIVAAAGPLFSFGLAIVFACLVWVIGYPEDINNNSTVIGYVGEDTPAEAAGLLPGDDIKSIDGKKVTSFMGMVDSVTWHIVSSEGKTVEFVVERDGKEMVIPVEPAILDEDWKAQNAVARWFQRPPTRKVGISPVNEKIRVGIVMENGPAEEAGLQEGDFLVSVKGEKILSYSALEMGIRDSLDQPVPLTVQRADGTVEEVMITPRKPENKGTNKEPGTVLGIVYGSTEPLKDGLTASAHPNPVKQISQTFRVMFNTITSVANPASDISIKHLSGPVGIINLYYRLFGNEEGWKLVLWFSVILNINLAILNMMPLPVLDGGHIVMAIVEGARGKPISPNLQGQLTAGFALLLMSFMLFVTVFDSGDVFKQNERYEPWTFAPKEASP